MKEGQGSLQEVESSCQEQGGERGGAVQGRGGVTAVLAAVALLPVHSVLQHTPVAHLQTEQCYIPSSNTMNAVYSRHSPL